MHIRFQASLAVLSKSQENRQLSMDVSDAKTHVSRLQADLDLLSSRMSTIQSQARAEVDAEWQSRLQVALAKQAVAFDKVFVMDVEL